MVYSFSGHARSPSSDVSAARKDAFRHRPRSLDRTDRRFHAATIRAACRVGAGTEQIVAASAWPGLLGTPHGMGRFGAGTAFQTFYKQDFRPAGRGQGPWCELVRGSTLNKQGVDSRADGGNHDGCRCATHWPLRYCRSISGDLLGDGSGLVYRDLLLNAGGS
jgi:hypothetical protein